MSAGTGAPSLRIPTDRDADGAAVGTDLIRPPVAEKSTRWTPMGSMFSMEHTTMRLSAPSRTTSIPYPFQPMTDSPTGTRPSGERPGPDRTVRPNPRNCRRYLPPYLRA